MALVPSASEGPTLRDTPLLDPRGLLALVAVAEQGSGAAAAKVLHWSAPTVDHHLRRLEAALRAPLVERTPRGSLLTEIGTDVLDQAHRILALGEQTAERVRVLRDHGRRLVRIGAFPTAGTAILPALHEDLRGSGIELEVTLDETVALASLFDAGRLDLAVTFIGGAEREARTSDAAGRRLLACERMRIIVAPTHPLAQREAVDLADFAEERWALSAGAPDPIDAVLIQRCRVAGFEPVVGMRSDDYSAIVELVAAGLVVALVPAWVAAGAGARVVALDARDARIEREIRLLVGRTDAVARAVADAVERIAAAHLGR